MRTTWTNQGANTNKSDGWFIPQYSIHISSAGLMDLDYRISSIRRRGYYLFRCSFCTATIWGWRLFEEIWVVYPSILYAHIKCWTNGLGLTSGVCCGLFDATFQAQRYPWQGRWVRNMLYRRTSNTTVPQDAHKRLVLQVYLGLNTLEFDRHTLN